MYAFNEKTIIEVAKTKRDLRRDGGSGPDIKGGKWLELILDIPLQKIIKI